MDNQRNHSNFKKIHLLPAIPILVILGLAVHLLLPQITSLEHSISIIRNLKWWAVALAFIAQGFSYMASGFTLKSILSANDGKFSIVKGALITMASASFGMIAGGWLGGAAATYAWISKEKEGENSAVLAGMFPGLLNNSVLIVISLIGAVYLLAIHDLSRLQLIEFSLISFLLTALSVGVFLSLEYPEKISRFAERLSGWWASLRHKPFEPEKFRASVKRILSAWETFRNGKWQLSIIGSAVAVLFDMLTINFMFVAAGHNVSPALLLAGYGLPLLLGKVAFIFPGGVGVVEGSMVALYTSLKVPNDISVVVILGYRLLSFWIPTLLGFLAAAYYSRKSIKNNGKQKVNV